METGISIGLIIKDSISKKRLREFGFLIGFGLPIIFGWIIPALGGNHFRSWTLWFAIPSLTIGILTPRLLFYPYKLWMALGLVLGWINSRIILGLVFLLVLEPISIVMKILGHDPLRTKRHTKKSYRENKENHKIDLKRVF